MTDTSKVQPSHLQRGALVYVRQSTPAQVEQHRESTQRQYALASRAAALGWSAAQINVIDEDLGLSGASAANRGGFARMGIGRRPSSTWSGSLDARRNHRL